MLGKSRKIKCQTNAAILRERERKKEKLPHSDKDRGERAGGRAASRTQVAR